MKRPKISSWPCTLHPTSRPTNEPRPRCRGCKAAWRRASYLDDQQDNPKARFRTWCANAKSRGFDVDITFRQWLYIKAQPCVYHIESGKSAITGIDRINNRRGYVQRNCQPCCERHNRIKSDVFTHAQMMDLVQRYNVECGDNKSSLSLRSKATPTSSPIVRPVDSATNSSTP
jgi:hypothetical protein